MELFPNITDFSHELLCQILKYLPLREILSVAMLCKKMATAVDMHLRLCKSIDFCQDAICGYMPAKITDDHLLILLKKCPHLEILYGLHPIRIERRRLRKRSALTIPGIIEALSLCFHLKAIETSDLRLFEAIMQHLPHIEIIGHFQNRDGLFPPQASQRLKLQPYPRISSLHLIGVEVPELTAMPHLQHLHLQCVRFTKLQPFRAFLAQNLKSFVMKHCIGPSVPQRYLSLIIALSSSPNLNHLELVRVPLLNGLFQRAVEDSYRHNGFVNLRTLVISGCKGVLEADLGHLMIVSSKNLETLYIQPSLTKDSLFVSLSYAQCVFPRLQNLHLGYIDTLNSSVSGEWSNEALLSLGLAEVPDTPSSITDSGMKVISELFPHIKTMSVSNCPHLMIMYHWMSQDDNEAWSGLTDLTLQKCHCLQLSSFAVFISFLSNIEVVILNDMFREPPKGCSHVGLSAGTGLGMSSAVVSNQDEHIAVQGHHQDFEHPGDEENEENEREFIDVENEEPHFMVLQRDFFDGEEEEEEDEGGDVVLDDQDPPVVEPQNSEEHSSAEDCGNGNSLQMNERAVVNESNFCNNESLTLAGDKILYSASSVISSDIKIGNADESSNKKQALKNHSLPSMKSVHVQCDTLPEECYQSSNSDTVKKSSFHNSDMSEDSYKSEDDIKMCVCSKLSDYNYHADYDPHKPSTSKAGRHFDYSVPCNAKLLNTSDSETDHYGEFGGDTEQSKESSNEQNFLETKSVTLGVDKLSTGNDQSIKLNVDDYPPKIENSNLCGEISNNSCLNTQNHFNNLSSSLDEMCKLVKPCIVLVSKLDSSSYYPDNSNVLDHGMNSFRNGVPTLISHNSLERECKFFSDSDLNESWSPDVNIRHLAKDSSNKSEEDTNFDDFQKHNEILVENIENSVGETNSMNNENVSENMICVFIERLDNVSDSEMLENCVESVELSGKTSFQDGGETTKICSIYSVANNKDSSENTPMQSEEIENSYEQLLKVDTYEEEDNYEHMETEKCDSVVKTENDCSQCYDNVSCVMYKNGKLNMLNNNEGPCNLQNEYEVPVNCSKMCEQCIAHCKKATETKEVCAISDCDKSDELSLKEEESCEFHRPEDILKLKTEETMGNEFCIVETNHDILSVNIGNVQEAVSLSTTNEKEVTLGFNTPVENFEMHNEEICKTSGKRSYTNSCKIEPCESSVIEKQNNTNPVITFAKADLTADDMKSSTCSLDKYLAIPENSSSKIHSSNLNRCVTCQLSVPREDGDHKESSAQSITTFKREKSLNHHANSGTYVLHSNACHSATQGENEGSSCSLSDLGSNVKDENKTAENSETESEFSFPIAKRLKRTYDEYHDDDSKYYVLVSDTSTAIINSLTGESHGIPACSVLLTKPRNKTSKLSPRSDIKMEYCKCKSKFPRNSNSDMNCSCCLPSGSKDKNHCESAIEDCKLNIRTRVNCSQKYVASDRRKGKTYPMRSKKRCRNSCKSEKVCKRSCKEDLKMKNESSHTHCRNICDDPSSSFSSSSKVRIEKLKITNSDASVFIKNQDEKHLLNLHVESKGCVENSDVNTVENSQYSNQIVKIESGERKGSSKNYSDVYQNNVDSQKEISSSSDVNVTRKRRRTRKKRISPSQKQKKKLFKNSLGKSNYLNKHTRRCSRKNPTVPTVSLISQGTQANSADIRRSVRRIRRSTAQARRTMPSIRVSRKSTHSSKVSAKALNKKPLNMNPRPEMHDKATSTSDPLLEDDAVQTLQLTSKTLLSFTVVSCGISDIIIDHCPKLFHVEVQACRILKKFHLNYCPAMKRLNVSQCPKLSICALASPVMAVESDSYLLVSYEPCLQGYHPGEGEKAILSRATLDQSVLICHDISAISHEGFQAMFKEKLIEWFHYLSKVHAILKPKSKILSKKYKKPECSDYPWSHDLRRFHGKYTYLPSTEFCHSDGRYHLVTNNTMFCDVFETHQLDTGFPAISDCDAHKDITLISHEAREKSAKMGSKFVGFYIPVTENNQINF